MKKFFLSILIVLSFYGISSGATTYYVATTGSDSHDGSSGSPWLTIQHAANTVSSGDTVIVAAGSYNERVTMSTSGADSSHYITFISSPARSATIYGFVISGSYIHVEGFNVTNPTNTCDNVSTQCYPAISINKSYAQVVNNYIYNWRGATAIGVVDLAWATRPSSAYIANNLIYHSQYGIGIWGDNWTVTGNEINRLFAYTFESYWDCDYVRAWGVGLTITNNYFHGTVLSEVVNPSSGLHAHVDCLQTWSYHSGVLQNLVYDRNWCSEYHEMMIQGTNSNFTISNSIFANAFVTDSGTLAGGLDIEGTTGVMMIGNTFYNGAVGPFCASSSTNCTARNNIIYNASCGANCNYAWQLLGTSQAEDHNLAYRTSGAIYNVFPGRGSEIFDATDKPNQDPLFVNTSNLVGADGIPFTADDGLRLQAGSPARGSGYGGMDMGAYAYVNPPPTAPINLRIIP